MSAREAASGTVLAIPLADGRTARLRVPPAKDGALVRAYLDDTEVLLRVRVGGAGAGRGPAAAGSRSSGADFLKGCLLPLVVVGLVIWGLVALSSHHDTTTASPATSAGSTATGTPTDDPYGSPDPYDSAASDGSDASPGSDSTDDPYVPPAPEPPPTSEAPDPYTKGTCLNGTLPHSTTAQSVSGVHEVSCSASDAHYKVIQTFPFTSDMGRCKANPRTQYAFSYRYTMNGATINEYVYCLVGLGSYAR
ncbi:LppU/SCO3897 family protein [Streptomyces beihaiensis]|uniref:Serine/threonine protein kinase n=1 Tax=Streptomyces beihaiensis TaxID=2984495 RepID=A0ABT3U4N8_9ACTN|nr:hypothetical protein [Streptomyces beihaiensis]MCX3063522.1 hypothetical protein [Streptomyces beihaiensis]